MGRSYAEGGEQQARAILRDLVSAPATAQHIARKLAQHSVADDPPASLVQRLADTFSLTGGDLASVYRELVGAREAWNPALAKFKSPWEWAVSSLRALGREELRPAQAINLMNQLGNPYGGPARPPVMTIWRAPGPRQMRCCAAPKQPNALRCKPATPRTRATWHPVSCQARSAARRPASSRKAFNEDFN